MEVFIPTCQERHEEFVPVFRGLLALSENNQRMVLENIVRYNTNWSDVVRLFNDKQFEVGVDRGSTFDHKS